ncbi:MAG: bifunctional (p)ppGpp synthetase/guanosine-3',5'-bis(diphosphate) 3'-pyrophosphohydrolase [Anaerolineae bacterium]|nr:bifunctional (p)ppGpp synthetase/guanosine-3',5'-bis(diphosphate) 3'-pyrophosphohydrolase [Anaerolineae bacterium]
MELDPIFSNLPALSPADRQFVVKAYRFAAHYHGDQKRASGDPYMVHCVAVAHILSDFKLDAHTIAAALLHDVIEDTTVTLEDLETDFGLEVARLVDGVTKLDKLPHDTEGMRGGKPGSREAETLRKIFLAMGNDVRVVLIKLADRLHNMRTLGYLREEKQQRMARETMDIYAPLASRLGIWQWKWELEDLAFRYLNPTKYREIARQLDQRRGDRERNMGQVKARLLKALAKAGIQAQISARPKHIYSIYRKMERKHVPFAEIYDVRAVRVIVADNPTCYQALGVVHSIWHPIPSEFDDYIAAPKENFYQSLHTAVLDDDGKTLEVQIRTQEMHENAEYGIAAHWRYKEGAGRDEEFEKRLRYLRRLMDFEDTVEDQNAEAFVDAMKSDVFQNRVYVFTPKGDIIDLPSASTPIDFAYHVHTEIGNRCRGARVNGELVALDYRLQSGERVEILTSKRGGPSLDWLNPDLGYVHTNRAKSKIRAWFKKQDREKNITLGRDVVDRELKKLGLAAMPRDAVAALFNFGKADDFLAAVGSGDLTGAQIAAKVLEHERKLERENPPDELVATAETPAANRPVNASDGIDIMGNTGMLINLARCCNPVHGDPIIGYITRGKGVTVHRFDCPNVSRSLEPERLINVNWGNSVEKMYPVPVIIIAYDREGLMRDVGAVIANESINMTNVNISTRNSVATFHLTMEMRNLEQVSRVLTKIEQLPNVIEVRRRVSS